ncbi:hypothetical protein N0O92_17520 [Alkalihalobacillus sp. MEB130]|uniref:hypothetical protein n=1 Tax=Alkalihalobacillus sp. MEB130 TaxID=2976704 RepID=UPI0028DE3D27|nr:hypothetical protein [Alkalihalobacillus sp. MEB130]MDT8862012.1 hypothetical protein [Alkalihalobacillus sp. MEB130]
MKQTGKMIGGILLLFIGVNILLGMIGVNIGGLLGVLIGAVLLYWGYSRYQIKDQWSFSSIILVALGVLMVLGGLGGIVSLVIGAFLIYGGYKLIRTKIEESVDLKKRNKECSYDTIDEEFTKLMEEGGDKYVR